MIGSHLYNSTVASAKLVHLLDKLFLLVQVLKLFVAFLKQSLDENYRLRQKNYLTAKCQSDVRRLDAV